MEINEEHFLKLEKFNNQITEMILDLKNEINIVRDDTLFNASYIKKIKDEYASKINVINNALKEQINDNINIYEELNENNGSQNYAEFLKKLLESDFKNLQNQMIEDSKREILNLKQNKKIKTKNNNFNIGIIFNILGLFGFIFSLLIILKYKLFFG